LRWSETSQDDVEDVAKRRGLWRRMKDQIGGNSARMDDELRTSENRARDQFLVLIVDFDFRL
jgi:hypothetical protein